ncbi:MAG: glycosyltransferase family 2 protein [Lentisphaerae bacterium]|nr:glycosyltransferase family 2 protein [Lentisphaerota bacterium]
MKDVPNNKVSIIVPFHNAERYLGGALTSIGASVHENVEVLMVDDFSTDSSGAIAGDFVRKDPRFQYSRNPANRGVSHSRNRGLDKAGGDFILFVDGDDRISPDWIRNLLLAATATKADIVIGQAKRIQGGHESDYRMKGLIRPARLRFERIVLKDNGVVWNKLYSAALLRRANVRFAEDIAIGEDLAFNYGVMACAEGIYYTDRGHYFYHRDNAASLMRGSSAESRVRNNSRVLETLLAHSARTGRWNRGALKKVARDILMDSAQGDPVFIDDATRERIRQIDPLMFHKVRFKLLRKSLKRKIAMALMSHFPGGAWRSSR